MSKITDMRTRERERERKREGERERKRKREREIERERGGRSYKKYKKGKFPLLAFCRMPFATNRFFAYEYLNI
jgi:hypothetical protein